jgi:hypothetical protein
MSLATPDEGNGEPRSDTNTKSECSDSFLSLRSARIFVTLQRIRGRLALLGAAHMEPMTVKVHLIPTQVDQLGSPLGSLPRNALGKPAMHLRCGSLQIERRALFATLPGNKSLLSLKGLVRRTKVYTNLP